MTMRFIIKQKNIVQGQNYCQSLKHKIKNCISKLLFCLKTPISSYVIFFLFNVNGVFICLQAMDLSEILSNLRPQTSLFLPSTKISTLDCLSIILDTLQELEKKYNDYDTTLTTPLMHAARHGTLEEVRLLFESRKFNINSFNFYWTTALDMAVIQGNPYIVQFLLENGALLTMEHKAKNAQTLIKETELKKAAYVDRPEEEQLTSIVKLLKEAEAKQQH